MQLVRTGQGLLATVQTRQTDGGRCRYWCTRFRRPLRQLLMAGCLSVLGSGCATLSPKFNVLPTVARHRAESQYQAARNAEQSGQLEKARELYAALQRQSPKTVEYAHRMGVVCTQLQDYTTAEKYFEHARSLDPRNPALLADMGYSAYLQCDYRAAEALLKESVQLRPGDSRAINNLALAIGFQERDDECLAMFRRCNSETQSMLNLAFVQSQRNAPDTAMATYQRVLAHEPGNKVANSALQQLHAASTQRQLAAQAARLVATAEAPSELPAVHPEPEQSPPQQAESAISGGPPTPLVVTAEEPPPGASEVVPVITPQGERSPAPTGDHWAATSTANVPDQTAGIAESPNEFELPLRAAPAQLPEEPLAPQAIVATPSSADDLANVFEPADDNAPETALSGTEELTGLEWAQEELARESAAAAAGAKTADQTRDCLRGFCPVALRDERRLAPTVEEFVVQYQDQSFHFSSAEARDKFAANPDWYAPAVGGLDIIQVKRGEAAAQGTLEHACWFRHRLHLFSSAENLASFRAAPREFVSTP